MMTPTSYILPDVYKSSYGIEINVEIKSEPESDEDLYDSLAPSCSDFEENNLNSQLYKNDEDPKELEEEPLVEIDSITVPQDLVEDELKPTLLLYVNSESPKCKLSKNNPLASRINTESTSQNNISVDKPSENEVAQRKAVTSALRSIKRKSYPPENNTNELINLNEEPFKIKCVVTTENSENISNGFQSPCYSSEKNCNLADQLPNSTIWKRKNIIGGSLKVRGTNKQLNRMNAKTCSKANGASEELTGLLSVNNYCKSKIKPKSEFVRKSGTEKKDKLSTEYSKQIEKDMVVQSGNPTNGGNKEKQVLSNFGIIASNEKSVQKKTKLKPISFDCTVCGKQFREKSHLATHSRAHVDIRNFKCNECGNSFKTKTNLLFHLKTHEEAPYICKKCDKTFPERKVLMRHIRVVHSGEGKYNCDQCGRSFKSSQNLELHYTLHTGNKPFSCNVCGKSFVYKMTYITHMRAHAADDAFNCELCPDAASKGELRRRCHHFSEARPWLCTVCGKGYPLKATLKSHMKTHEPEKAFKCDECGKSFVKKQAYESHIKSHKGESPQFMCDQCSQSYFNVFALKRHYLKHTSERKFICDICSKAFWTKDALKVHKRSHVNVKMFHCTQCSKSFAHKHTLVAHSKSHYNEQSFTCGACPKTFIHKYNLDRHERQHTMTPIPPHPSLAPSLIMMAPPKHLDFSTLHIL